MTAGDLSRRRVAPWAFAILLVAVGVVAGAAIDRLAAGRPRPPGPPAPEEMTARMSRDLALTDGQARAVRQILDERWTALGKLFERIDPEAEAIRRDADARIRALLQPEQRARFETQVAEWERRRAETRKRLGRAPLPPPPP